MLGSLWKQAMCPVYKLTNACNSLNRTDMIITEILTVIFSVVFISVTYRLRWCSNRMRFCIPLCCFSIIFLCKNAVVLVFDVFCSVWCMTCHSKNALLRLKVQLSNSTIKKTLIYSTALCLMHLMMCKDRKQLDIRPLSQLNGGASSLSSSQLKHLPFAHLVFDVRYHKYKCWQIEQTNSHDSPWWRWFESLTADIKF